MELTSVIVFIESLGGSEIFLVLLAVLLLFGAKKIPELAKGLGKGIREFKDATQGVQDELTKRADASPIVKEKVN
jgi:sec-independent protein translocase protein TatA